MIRKVKSEDWKPSGIESLEPAADLAVRSDESRLVVAGPGAGKTELLAQRACYLLQTGICNAPHRILAISFKRDAAENLRRRVKERCGLELSRRFDSITFDAFSKSLVDRFRQAIAPAWRPRGGYRIEFKLTDRSADKFFTSIPSEFGGLSPGENASLQIKRAYDLEFLGKRLPLPNPKSLEARAAMALWRYMLQGGDRSSLSFPMIGRLAEFLLSTNPKILTALRTTYTFVFLDEFQDATNIQYDLTVTAFKGSRAVLTAVGDNKQRIMTWAGALSTAFADFERDFGAERIHLLNNYRSAPNLVRIGNFLSAHIDDEAPEAEAVRTKEGGEGECRVLLFRTHFEEATFLTDSIVDWVTNDGVKPREICIITRNRPADYTRILKDALEGKGIEARIESELQDLLAEPISAILIHSLRMASQKAASRSREALLDLLLSFADSSSERACRKLEEDLNRFVKELRQELLKTGKAKEDLSIVVQKILSFFTTERLYALYPQYAEGDYLSELLEEFESSLVTYLARFDWPEALDALEGTGSIPMMTMHKSKGLEYHTVVFVGLEDSALWGFANREAEETCGFFVAFSRAKNRVIFTFCRSRPRTPDDFPAPQQRRAIGKLYALLESAGVGVENI